MFILLLSAMTAVSYAQNYTVSALKGSWGCDAKRFIGATEDVEGVEFKNANLVFTFSDRTVNISMDLNMDAGSASEFLMRIGARIQVSAIPYQLSKDILTISKSPNKPVVDIYQFDLIADANTKAALKAAGMTEASLKEMMQQELAGQSFMQEGLNFDGEMTIESLTSTKLILSDKSGETMVFNRVSSSTPRR